eukprot:scpid50089/ scgid33764/ 
MLVTEDSDRGMIGTQSHDKPARWIALPFTILALATGLPNPDIVSGVPLIGIILAVYSYHCYGLVVEQSACSFIVCSVLLFNSTTKKRQESRDNPGGYGLLPLGTTQGGIPQGKIPFPGPL